MGRSCCRKSSLVQLHADLNFPRRWNSSKLEWKNHWKRYSSKTLPAIENNTQWLVLLLLELLFLDLLLVMRFRWSCQYSFTQMLIIYKGTRFCNEGKHYKLIFLTYAIKICLFTIYHNKFWTSVVIVYYRMAYFPAVFRVCFRNWGQCPEDTKKGTFSQQKS